MVPIKIIFLEIWICLDDGEYIGEKTDNTLSKRGRSQRDCQSFC